ncbi:MAG TPA: metalloregulator ArsR/SmtB family transcription factor [Acidimicrobiia bacterium]|nr:metalloregulator ArsR/SmtB family transcription factor [Acidimicrobiia bacterium]
MSDVFAALSDPTRREILRRLGQSPATATELSAVFPISRQAISKHLAALDQAGLVERTSSGREVRFSLRSERLDDVMGWVAEVGGEWDQRLARLKGRLGG